MRDPLTTRLAVLVCLVVALSALFVLYGAEIGQPTGPPFGTDDIAEDPDRILGERVETSGSVVATNPVRIEAATDGDTIELVIEDAPDATVGDHLMVVGILTAERTVAADRERTVVREPWELQYMYAISVVGALIVAIRIANGWLLRPAKFVFEPRERPLFARYLRDESDGNPEGGNNG